MRPRRRASAPQLARARPAPRTRRRGARASPRRLSRATSAGSRRGLRQQDVVAQRQLPCGNTVAVGTDHAPRSPAGTATRPRCMCRCRPPTLPAHRLHPSRRPRTPPAGSALRYLEPSLHGDREPLRSRLPGHERDLPVRDAVRRRHPVVELDERRADDRPRPRASRVARRPRSYGRPRRCATIERTCSAAQPSSPSAPTTNPSSPAVTETSRIGPRTRDVQRRRKPRNVSGYR